MKVSSYCIHPICMHMYVYQSTCTECAHTTYVYILMYVCIGCVVYKTKDKSRYTIDTSKLGSTVMETMLREVSDFCQPSRMKDWTTTTKQQVTCDHSYIDCVARTTETIMYTMSTTCMYIFANSLCMM